MPIEIIIQIHHSISYLNSINRAIYLSLKTQPITTVPGYEIETELLYGKQ